jgi:SAM-dependent methyltransferase
MDQPVSPFVPDFVKSTIKRAAARAAGTHELERRLRELERALVELAPDAVPVSDELRAVLDDFLRAQSIEDLDVTVSKNDLMFKYIEREKQSRAESFLWYLESGLQMQRIVEAIAARKAGDITAVGTVLDFACGYGRLTRFLAGAMDPSLVWASDIKADAVRFVTKQFGVRGFVSTEEPLALPSDQPFDIIFVASLFSHLPDATFGTWLQRLVDALEPGGLVAFSVHDVELVGKSRSTSTDAPVNEFTRMSEEVSLQSENDPLSVDSYGTSVVNESYVNRIVRGLAIENHEYWRYPRAIHGIQDLYIVSRDPAADFSGLKFPGLSSSLAKT